MGQLFKEHEDWTYGVECEMNCEVEQSCASNFLYILDGSSRTSFRVTGDMGSTSRKKVEIVTEPIRIDNVKAHDENAACFSVLKELLYEISQSPDGLPGKSVENKFQELISGNQSLAGYTCQALGTVKILCLSDSVRVAAPQMTVGMPCHEAEEFLNISRPGWYQVRETVVPGTDVKGFYEHYACCILRKLAELYDQEKDITSSIVKNEWEIMPRSRVDLLLDRNAKQNIVNLTAQWSQNPPPSAQALEQARQDLFAGQPVGGHLTSIRQAVDAQGRTVPQLLFEYRSIPGNLYEYYFDGMM